MWTFKDSIARCLKLESDDQVVLGRAALLPSADRDLIVAVWTYRTPVRILADMAGVTPASIRARVRGLIRRLHSRHFLSAARVLHRLNDPQAVVARLHLLGGHSLRATAEAAGLHYHRVRRLVSEVQGIIDAHAGDRPAAPAAKRALGA